jgi:carboxylesterase type B
VAVFVQYRLGVLGFLPPSVAPSSPDPNLGLRDVVLALQTVKDGIAYAGGDSSRVTLAGESSGASLIRGESSHKKLGV